MADANELTHHHSPGFTPDDRAVLTEIHEIVRQLGGSVVVPVVPAPAGFLPSDRTQLDEILKILQRLTNVASFSVTVDKPIAQGSK